MGTLNTKPIRDTRDTLNIGVSRKTLTGLTVKTSNSQTYEFNSRLTALRAYRYKGVVIKVA